MYNIFDKLKNYSDSDYYAFHMPGHKRNLDLMDGTSPYLIDITEIDGFDDLHHAEGLLKEAQERAAKVYHASETHFLINGSTAGIISAILGTTEKGDSILVARNCHKSVYHAIYLNELDPVYLYPKFDTEQGLSTEIDVADVQKALEEHPKIRAVMIVSPTYDGVVSDIEKIAEIVHEAGCLLIVDEAHGAHFGFDPYFPESANMYGADLVINSLHKTLPALTQTALLHVNGNMVNRRKEKQYLDMLQTSSPSYILMASIDACIGMLEETLETHSDARSDYKYKNIFSEYANRIEALRKDLKRLKYLKIIQTDNTDRYDRSKFVISVKHAPMSSHELYEILLHRYHLQMEMAAGNYVTAIMTCCDTADGWQRLGDALKEIDDFCVAADEPVQENRKLFAYPVLKQQISLTDALDAPKAQVPLTEAVGQTAGAFINLYPPGIPIVAPGEQITQEAVDVITRYRQMNLPVQGVDHDAITILKLC